MGASMPHDGKQFRVAERFAAKKRQLLAAEGVHTINDVRELLGGQFLLRGAAAIRAAGDAATNARRCQFDLGKLQLRF